MSYNVFPKIAVDIEIMRYVVRANGYIVDLGTKNRQVLIIDDFYLQKENKQNLIF